MDSGFAFRPRASLVHASTTVVDVPDWQSCSLARVPATPVAASLSLETRRRRELVMERALPLDAVASKTAVVSHSRAKSSLPLVPKQVPLVDVATVLERETAKEEAGAKRTATARLSLVPWSVRVAETGSVCVCEAASPLVSRRPQLQQCTSRMVRKQRLAPTTCETIPWTVAQSVARTAVGKSQARIQQIVRPLHSAQLQLLFALHHEATSSPVKTHSAAASVQRHPRRALLVSVSSSWLTCAARQTPVPRSFSARTAPVQRLRQALAVSFGPSPTATAIVKRVAWSLHHARRATVQRQVSVAVTHAVSVCEGLAPLVSRGRRQETCKAIAGLRCSHALVCRTTAVALEAASLCPRQAAVVKQAVALSQARSVAESVAWGRAASLGRRTPVAVNARESTLLLPVASAASSLTCVLKAANWAAVKASLAANVQPLRAAVSSSVCVCDSAAHLPPLVVARTRASTQAHAASLQQTPATMPCVLTAAASRTRASRHAERGSVLHVACSSATAAFVAGLHGLPRARLRSAPGLLRAALCVQTVALVREERRSGAQARLCSAVSRVAASIPSCVVERTTSAGPAAAAASVTLVSTGEPLAVAVQLVHSQLPPSAPQPVPRSPAADKSSRTQETVAAEEEDQQDIATSGECLLSRCCCRCCCCCRRGFVVDARRHQSFLSLRCFLLSRYFVSSRLVSSRAFALGCSFRAAFMLLSPSPVSWLSLADSSQQPCSVPTQQNSSWRRGSVRRMRRQSLSQRSEQETG